MHFLSWGWLEIEDGESSSSWSQTDRIRYSFIEHTVGLISNTQQSVVTSCQLQETYSEKHVLFIFAGIFSRALIGPFPNEPDVSCWVGCLKSPEVVVYQPLLALHQKVVVGELNLGLRRESKLLPGRCYNLRRGKDKKDLFIMFLNL